MRPKSAIALGGVLAALATSLAHRPASRERPSLAPSARHVRGAVHVHTGASGDGHGTLDDVARAAREAGLAFAVVTDHNGEASLGIDGYRRGVLLLGGLEKSTDAGHALALGLADLPFRLDGDPATVVRDVADLGGFVIAAHPRSGHPESRWSAGLAGVSGIEILNLAEPGAWPSGLALLPAVTRYLADPQGALLRSLRFSRAALQLWDRTSRERPLAGLLGSDAHGGFPSHREIFRLASQHLLLERPLQGEAVPDRALVLDALRRGSGWVALDALADASGFLFEARCAGRVAGPGESLSLEGTAEIEVHVDAPRGTLLVLLRDGAPVTRGAALRHRTRLAGTYRVEAWLPSALDPGRPKPWILANPIHLYDAPTLAARAERASRLPPLAEPPASSEVLDSFADGRLATRWQIDRAKDARGHAKLESGALRLDFALGRASRTHVSLCDWGRRDLSRHAALVFRVRGDRRFRFDVQVRVEDAQAPESVRIWRRSVRAEADWRSVAVRFAELKTYDRLSGPPDLSRARGIYFHVDEAHLAPGTRGTLWIDDLGLAR